MNGTLPYFPRKLPGGNPMQSAQTGLATTGPVRVHPGNEPLWDRTYPEQTKAMRQLFFGRLMRYTPRREFFGYYSGGNRYRPPIV